MNEIICNKCKQPLKQEEVLPWMAQKISKGGSVTCNNCYKADNPTSETPVKSEREERRIITLSLFPHVLIKGGTLEEVMDKSLNLADYLIKKL